LRARAEKNRVMHVKFYTQGMPYLAQWIANTQVKRPVVDRTGLTSKYTFLLEYQIAAQGAEPSEETQTEIPTLFGALGAQLGLRLVKASSEVEKLVIERANRVSSEN
jgi:uncharacterized protein (TIGR03435 family)